MRDQLTWVVTTVFVAMDGCDFTWQWL